MHIFKHAYMYFWSIAYNPSVSMSLSEALLTTAIDTVSEFQAEALQATASEGLAQGPYAMARAGLEPMTLWSKGIDSTNVPPCPHKCA